MCKSKSLFIISIFALFIGCSNSHNVKLSYTDVETIKDYVKDRELDVTWTKEVEGALLNEDISSNEKIKTGELITPELLQIIPVYQTAEYPSIENFGSLNTSSFPSAAQTKLDEFCSTLSKNIYSGAENYFDNSYIFNLVFFKNDLIDNWPFFFEEDFPVKQEDFEKKSEESKEGTSEKKEESTEEAEEDLPDPIFTKWYIGEPFISTGMIEVPVRFFSKKGTIDVTIFMSTTDEGKIYQIIIDRWGKSNG